MIFGGRPLPHPDILGGHSLPGHMNIPDITQRGLVEAVWIIRTLPTRAQASDRAVTDKTSIVLALYKKSNGQYGKHSAIDECNSVSALSCAAVKAYEQMHLHQFHSMVPSMRGPQVSRFALVPPISILCLIPGITKPISTGLELSNEGLVMFTRLEQGIVGFRHVDKLSRKRKETD